jgi:flagellar protein FlaG
MEIQSVSGVAAAAQPAREARETPALPVFSTPEPKSELPTKEEVREAVKEIRQNVGGNSTNLQFTVDEASGRTIVSVIDSETRQVVRQIPSEEIMRMARAMDRMQGLLFNGKA